MEVLVLRNSKEQNSAAAIIPKKFSLMAPSIGFMNKKLPIPIIRPK